MKYTLDQIKRVCFLHNLEWVIGDSQYTGPETQAVRDLLPEDIEEQYQVLLADVLEHVRGLDLDQVEEFIRQLPPGYLRFRCVDIQTIRERQHERP